MNLPLWRRRVNCSILYYIYDSHSRRDRTNYTRLNYDPTQRNLKSTDLTRINTNSSHCTHNQSFNMACRNFIKRKNLFMESASRNKFEKNANSTKNHYFMLKGRRWQMNKY